MRNILLPFVSVTLLFAGTVAHGQNTDTLYEGFKNPPREVRPRVWWHWMNGNITKEGIRKDLMWMNEAGIVGFHNFDAGLETPQIIERRISYMTPEWKDCFSYALDLADSLDMEVTIAASPGWSETGGPWVKPEEAMKKLVWREIDVDGGSVFELPDGFDVTGKYLDFPMQPKGLESKFAGLKFYKDIVVVAVKLSDKDVDFNALRPELTSSGVKGDLSREEILKRLNSDSISDFVYVTPKDGWSWIEYSFDKPQTIKSVIVTEKKVEGDENTLIRELQCCDDGFNYKTVATLGYQASQRKVYSFPAVTAKRFRVRFKDTEEGKNSPFAVSQFILSSMTMVQDAGDKAGGGHYRLLPLEITPETDDAPRLEDVVDLTDKFKDGILTWDVPEGRWRIFRFGYSLTGKTNHPATAEATGLEVDKLDPDAVRHYLNEYLETYRKAGGRPLGPGGIEYLLTDSYEAGAQNWTGNMFNEFKARTGYDLIKWMPALTGMILDNTGSTERFLFDWRRALGDMMAEYHYDLQSEILAPLGMKRYTESHESWRSNLTDGMDCKRLADVPMSAFWMQYNQGLIFNNRFEADIRESASTAHLYGQNIAAAESFTSNGFRDGAWVFSPALLKPTADAALASGLNRFVIHTSVHQPVDDKVPGLGLGPFGQWFNRHQTWASDAKAWTDYLSRSCYMLQQGRFAADIAYYYGEDNNVTGLFMYNPPAVPEGYNYDFFSPSVLIDLASTDGNDIVTNSGMRYKVLILDSNARIMSLRVLRKIKELADAGVTICGAKPERLASNAGAGEGYATPVDEFDALVKDIWESGRKNVTHGTPAGEALKRIGVEPDVKYSSGYDPELRFVHRSLETGDIYWIANISERKREFEASLRIEGKRPYIWHAEDGTREPADYKMVEGRTLVKLSLDKCQSVFIILTEDTNVKEWSADDKTLVAEKEMESPWRVAFQENRGAPSEAIFENLISYTENGDEGIKFFSGVASYNNEFKIRGKDLGKDRTVLLDLGEVKDMAKVIVNGKEAGIVWTNPFKVDITDYVKKGANKVEVKVTNVWHNRIVGDMQPGVTEKVTYTPIDFFTAEEPLLPSGLLGPVRIIIEE